MFPSLPAPVASAQCWRCVLYSHPFHVSFYAASAARAQCWRWITFSHPYSMLPSLPALLLPQLSAGGVSCIAILSMFPSMLLLLSELSAGGGSILAILSRFPSMPASTVLPELSAGGGSILPILSILPSLPAPAASAQCWRWTNFSQS